MGWLHLPFRRHCYENQLVCDISVFVSKSNMHDKTMTLQKLGCKVMLYSTFVLYILDRFHNYVKLIRWLETRIHQYNLISEQKQTVVSCCVWFCLNAQNESRNEKDLMKFIRGLGGSGGWKGTRSRVMNVTTCTTDVLWSFCQTLSDYEHNVKGYLRLY